MRVKTRSVALMGVCVAFAMILSYVESFIPSPVYGVKIGLPNIVTVYLLYKCGAARAGAVSVVRVILTALLFGSVMSLIYSLAGAFLSLSVMVILKKTNLFSKVGVSIAGGVSHNIAQLAVAVAITGVGAVAYYLPTLVLGGVVAGIVVGIAGATVIKRV